MPERQPLAALAEMRHPVHVMPPAETRDQRTYSNFINGAWIPSRSGRLVENRNPANQGDLIGHFQDSDATDVQDAVAAAARAYEGWRLVPAPKRAEILLEAARLI